MDSLAGSPRIRRSTALRPAAMLVSLVITLGSAGCMSIGGEDHRNASSPTLGKELQDLKTAHDRGAISDQEFEQAKTKLLAGPRQPNLQSRSIQASRFDLITGLSAQFILVHA